MTSIKEGTISLDEAVTILNTMGAEAQTAMEVVKEAMKDINMEEVMEMA
jgi:hypothetical protein